MIEVNIDINASLGPNCWGQKEIKTFVDFELLRVFQIITDTRKYRDGDNDMPKGAVYYKKKGYMSKDSGFHWIHFESGTHGQTQSLFYFGIAPNTEYIDLDAIEPEAEHRMKDLMRVK
jgi:hypothetical protein